MRSGFDADQRFILRVWRYEIADAVRGIDCVPDFGGAVDCGKFTVCEVVYDGEAETISRGVFDHSLHGQCICYVSFTVPFQREEILNFQEQLCEKIVNTSILNTWFDIENAGSID